MRRCQLAVKGLLGAMIGVAHAQTPPSPFVVPPPISPQTAEPWRVVREDEFVTEIQTRFASPVPSGVAANDRVPLRLWLPAGRTAPVPVVVAAHFWGATDYRAETALAREFAERGIGLAAIALPFHLERTPSGTRSGDLAVVPDPDALRRNLIQSVADLHRAVDLLVQRPEVDASRLGVMGTSLGSLVAELAYGQDPRLIRAAFLLGGADIPYILLNSSRISDVRDGLRRLGWTEARLREVLTDVDPITYLPRSAPGRTYLIAARFDSVIPASATQALREKLSGGANLIIDTGHYGGVFVQSRLQREVARFFSSEFEGRTYVAPEKLLAPTVRLGLRYDVRDGFEVGAGIDVWRFLPEGRGVATAFASPRGLSLQVVYTVAGGLGGGVFIAPGKVGLGLFWSAVL
jgi:dienelactone hydrolase